MSNTTCCAYKAYMTGRFCDGKCNSCHRQKPISSDKPSDLVPDPTQKTYGKFEAEWTGQYPNPTQGEWILKKNGVDVSHFVPSILHYGPANTFGEYPVYNLNPGAAVSEFVRDGLKAPEWIRANLYWLVMVCDDDTDYLSVYLAFHASDFRVAPYFSY